jgi:hypothetical protein
MLRTHPCFNLLGLTKVYCILAVSSEHIVSNGRTLGECEGSSCGLYQGNSFEGRRSITKNMNEYSRFSGRDSNHSSPKALLTSLFQLTRLKKKEVGLYRWI